MVGTARDEAQRATRIGARLCPPYPFVVASQGSYFFTPFVVWECEWL